MRGFTICMLTLVFVMVFSIVISGTSFADEKDDHSTINGNVVCLLPDYEKGTVNAVIATKPCDGYPPHHHVVVTDTAVYSLQGLQDGLMKIEQTSNRKNVAIMGKVKGSEQTGWILFVN